MEWHATAHIYSRRDKLTMVPFDTKGFLLSHSQSISSTWQEIIVFKELVPLAIPNHYYSCPWKITILWQSMYVESVFFYDGGYISKKSTCLHTVTTDDLNISERATVIF
jgi:hypothetical protein